MANRRRTTSICTRSRVHLRDLHRSDVSVSAGHRHSRPRSAASHTRDARLARGGQHPGPTAFRRAPATAGRFVRACSPRRCRRGSAPDRQEWRAFSCGTWVTRCGGAAAHAGSRRGDGHRRDVRRPAQRDIPLRNTVCPGERSPVVVRDSRRPRGRAPHDRTVADAAGGGPPAPRTPRSSIRGRSGRSRSVRRGDARRGACRCRAGMAAAVTYGVEYLEHSIPARLKAGRDLGVRVTLENTGAITWRSRRSIASSQDRGRRGAAGDRAAAARRRRPPARR